jgi:hypothetical protein
MKISIEAGHEPTWAHGLPREEQAALIAYFEATKLKKIHANQDAMINRGAQ